MQQYSTALREHAPHYAKMKGQRENHSGKLDILKDKKIGFIGGGKMAEAIVNGMLAQEIPASAITVSDPNPGTEGALLFFWRFTKCLERRQVLGKLGLNPVGPNTAAVENSDVVVLAIKPQTMDKVW